MMFQQELLLTERLYSPGRLTFISGLSVCFRYSLRVSKLSSVSSILTYFKNVVNSQFKKILNLHKKMLKQRSTGF